MAGFWNWEQVFRGFLIGVYCWLSNSQDITTTNVYYEEPYLVCGEERLEYAIPPINDAKFSVRLVVQDRDGNLKPLMSNSSCGIWATPASDGFLYVDVEYDGCFIEKEDNYYRMTLLMQHNVTGKWEVFEKETLRCEAFEAKDAPALNVCSEVQRSNRLPCDGVSLSEDTCLQLGCCYDPSDAINPCYYGDKVTAQCTRDGQLSVAISKDVALPSLVLNSVRLLRDGGAGCAPVAQNDAFVLFQFPLSACGTRRSENSGNVLYENDLIAEKDIRTLSGVSITRDSTFRLHIRCSFAASGSEPLSVEVYTLAPPPPVSSSGPLTLEMRIAQTNEYAQYYEARDYPIVKYLREPVYVEVRILHRTDPGLILVLEDCWATPSANPMEQLQWPILVDRCPFAGDNYKTQLLSNTPNSAADLASHYKRFILGTFTFLDQTSQEALGGLVFLHCSASACTPSSLESCDTTCSSKRRRRAIEKLKDSSLTLVSSQGPIEFYSENERSSQTGNS
ncbi:zona pellucida sperm-binding protein 4-like [Spea bombifrons]|uniref:zona pellucida sperm-binding protein 4-like n=1 Tax=Spea bombifrons TaxID=233779 RepID=UPI00234981BE|nr:zona pellucida sperm-binding protein 4-like [Spea bombifrons]